MSDKCPKCGSAALSPDHPKWFECGTIGDRRGTFHHTTTCHYFSEFRKPLDDRIKRLEDCVETAWGVIANVDSGSWGEQRADWREAAIRWRDDQFHPAFGLTKPKAKESKP